MIRVDKADGAGQKCHTDQGSLTCSLPRLSTAANAQCFGKLVEAENIVFLSDSVLRIRTVPPED